MLEAGGSPTPKRVRVQLLPIGTIIVPVGVQLPLPLIVTVPQVHPPEPTKMWLEIGSNPALRSAGFAVMRAVVKIAGRTHGKTAGETHETAMVGVDPAELIKVNWVGKQIPNVLRGSLLRHVSV